MELLLTSVTKLPTHSLVGTFYTLLVYGVLKNTKFKLGLGVYTPLVAPLRRGATMGRQACTTVDQPALYFYSTHLISYRIKQTEL